MQETWVWSLGWEDPLEEEMASHSSVLAWRILWIEEPAGCSPRHHKESNMTQWAQHRPQLIYSYLCLNPQTAPGVGCMTPLCRVSNWGLVLQPVLGHITCMGRSLDSRPASEPRARFNDPALPKNREQKRDESLLHGWICRVFLFFLGTATYSCSMCACVLSRFM